MGRFEIGSVIMLILGSNSPEMRKQRVNLAHVLITKKGIRFDKTILSGGCGAHGTDDSNCEASDMEKLIKAFHNERISIIPIYKEEKSGFTRQNYCFCRDLKDNGDKLNYYSCEDSLYDDIPPTVEKVAKSEDSCYRDYAGIALNCNSRNWCKQFQIHQ